MQRSTPSTVRNMVRGQWRSLADNLGHLRRGMASSSWGNPRQGGGKSKGASGAGSDGSLKTDKSEATSKKTMTTTAVTKGGPPASATFLVSSDAGHQMRGVNQGALERRINREDNMWRNRNSIDTKWLNPRDPCAYRPDFRLTEPPMLRKQFMRSPDEVSREVLGRDWEEAIKVYRRTAMGQTPDDSRKTGWEE